MDNEAPDPEQQPSRAHDPITDTDDNAPVSITFPDHPPELNSAAAAVLVRILLRHAQSQQDTV
ncbi:hypothetical protein DFR76_11561 [Nocardia pseudobrasiliensis]|uniref:Uncharacterized protein n=1 Tax=Nocardia pseudobrasiliensis TaxID=45979 RepID=A0A370HR43_9NOCA|nr:hypothetical protein DFR76_11561 [Nocardia pseudobrasiliensis]